MKKLYDIDATVSGVRTQAAVYQVGDELITVGERTKVDEVPRK